MGEVANTGYLLAAIVVHGLIYPLSTLGGIGPVLLYAFYASMLVVATWLLTAERGWHLAALATGLAVFAAGVVNSYAQSPAAALKVDLTSIAYHTVILVVLARYSFSSQKVLTEVLLAATSRYRVLGSIFAAIFGVILWVDPGALVWSLGQEVHWQ